VGSSYIVIEDYIDDMVYMEYQKWLDFQKWIPYGGHLKEEIQKGFQTFAISSKEKKYFSTINHWPEDITKPSWLYSLQEIERFLVATSHRKWGETCRR
jgi:hypothetical protein